MMRFFFQSVHQNVNEAIREVLVPFGEIESVKSTCDGQLSNKVFEALVTFVHSESAFNVLVANHNGSFISEHLVSVMPADTSRQCQTECATMEQMDIIDDSHDEPEIENVIQNLQELSLKEKSRMHFCCGRNDYRFEIDLGLGLNLKQIRKLIFQIEPFQKHLVLDYGCLDCVADDDESDENDALWNIDKIDFEKQATETITKMCAKMFNRMTIRGKVEISNEMLQWLQPLLKRLHYLNIETFSNGHIHYVLHAYCPNLSELRFHGCKWKGGDVMSSTSLAWPSLTYLAVKYVELNIGSDTENGKRFQQFIELNPQLQVLELEPVVDNVMLMNITEHLPNLCSLIITRHDCSESESIINAISGLKQLSSIQMTTLITQKGDLHVISNFIRQFSSLNLVVFIQNYERDFDGQSDFERLADFPVIHHNGCNCNADGKRSLSFEDYLDDVSIPKDQPVAVLIVNTNVTKTIDEILSVEIVHMLNDSKTFYPNVIKQQTLHGEDHQTIIHVATA